MGILEWKNEARASDPWILASEASRRAGGPRATHAWRSHTQAHGPHDLRARCLASPSALARSGSRTVVMRARPCDAMQCFQAPPHPSSTLTSDLTPSAHRLIVRVLLFDRRLEDEAVNYARRRELVDPPVRVYPFNKCFRSVYVAA